MMNTIYPEVTHGIVNRVTGSIFGYQAWGTVARDEEGTLYTVTSGFRVSHICPFGKTVMYISKNEGKTWSPPIVINDTYLDDRDAGIVSLGGGRLLVTWFTHPTDVYRQHGCPAFGLTSIWWAARFRRLPTPSLLSMRWKWNGRSLPVTLPVFSPIYGGCSDMPLPRSC